MSRMLTRAAISSLLTGAAIALAATAVLAGCGASSQSSSVAHIGAGEPASTTCAQTVLGALGDVAMRIYREGVASERTVVAAHLIDASRPLRRAVERDDAPAARTAALALIATGHMTNLKIMRGGRVLADVGSPAALAPVSGIITGTSRSPIGTFVTSVWSDEGFLLETDGITGGAVALRSGGRSIAGSFELPAGQLPRQGTLSWHGIGYQYTSFPAQRYPSGPVDVYLLRTIDSTRKLCGPTSEDTLFKTMSHIASLIYAGEAGGRALTEVHRVQNSPALLRAVARREPAATRQAVSALLNQHIVRLRVSAGGRLLADVGGPFVLAPVEAPLRLDGRTIGSFVLSIQDDEGYKRLAGRLADLRVLMYMGSKLVKNSLGPNPRAVPASGSYSYGGNDFRVFTLNETAFPSGPLTIRVLIPIPYS